MSENSSPAKYFICGGFGGLCSVMTGHPLDTIKVRLQTMPWPEPGEKPLYCGTWDCIIKALKNEGFPGLYRGMTVPLSAIAPIFATSFFGFGLGKQLFKEDPYQVLTMPQTFVAGAISGLLTTTVMAPGERIKCLLQIQRDQATVKYTSLVDCVRQLYAEGGIRSIYKGSFATLLRDVPATGTYFMTYEWVKDIMVPAQASGQVNLLCAIFAGGCAGIGFWTIALPAAGRA